MKLVLSWGSDIDQSKQRRTTREAPSCSYIMYSVEEQVSFKVGGFVHNASKGKYELLYFSLPQLPQYSSDICKDLSYVMTIFEIMKNWLQNCCLTCFQVF